MRAASGFALVALGGALGSMARYAVSLWFAERIGAAFPWGTFAINVVGSFAIGIVIASIDARPDPNGYVRVFLTTGILGGFTTFSAFAYETYALATRGFALTAFAYAAGSVVAGLAAAALGVAVATRP